MTLRGSSLLLLPPALVLGLAACSGEPDPSDASTPAPTVTVTAPAPGTPSASAVPSASATAAVDPVGVEAVVAAALEAVGSGTVVSVDEEDDDDGGWDVDVVVGGGREQQVQVGNDGEVRSGPVEDETDAEDRRENQRLVDAATADLADVAAGAVQAAGGGRATDLALEEDDGAITWEVDVEPVGGGADRTIVVDPGTGEVR